MPVNLKERMAKVGTTDGQIELTIAGTERYDGIGGVVNLAAGCQKALEVV